MTAYKKGFPTRVSESFLSTEFDCRCKRPDCQTTQIDADLLRRLEALRKSVHMPVHVTSGFRCKAYQSALRDSGIQAAILSQHELGRAADIRVKGLTSAVLREHAIMVGFKAIGFAKTFIHVDLRSDKVRRWNYQA